MPRSTANKAKSLDVHQVTDTQLVKLAPRPQPLDGLLALLVTDLEGFTPMVEALGDAKARLVMREHDRLMRSCFDHWSGHEIAHTGDGFLVAFRSVKAALLCARDMQRELSERAADAPLRVRIGIHAGEPLTEDKRLFGISLNTAVRVCAAAASGSILVTDVIKQLAQGHFTFRHGRSHSLKGLAQPVMLYEYAWQDAD